MTSSHCSIRRRVGADGAGADVAVPDVEVGDVGEEVAVVRDAAAGAWDDCASAGTATTNNSVHAHRVAVSMCFLTPG